MKGGVLSPNTLQARINNIDKKLRSEKNSNVIKKLTAKRRINVKRFAIRNTKKNGKLKIESVKDRMMDEFVKKTQAINLDKMILPTFNEIVLHQPELVEKMIKELDNEYPKYKSVTDLAKMTLKSTSTNDYLEKIAVESIGFKHIEDKLGADGVDPTIKVEAKPSKDKFGAVINDDSPMKLLKSFKEIQWILFLNANRSGTKVNVAILAPFSAWDNSRYNKICEHLKLDKDATWKHSYEKLPEDIKEKEKILNDLVLKHVKKQYIRASPLKLDILNTIPKDKIRVWKHADYPKSSLPKAIQNLF